MYNVYAICNSINEIHILNRAFNLLLSCYTLLTVCCCCVLCCYSCRRAVLVSAGCCCCYWAEVVVYCGLLATRCPFSALRKAPREKWYQSLGTSMGPRRGAGSQSSAARMPGQEPESPRRAASPSERAVEPEDENSRLRETVMNLEEKVSSLESEIAMLSSDLEDCRHVTQELASALGGSGVADMRREMEQMSIQIGLLQRAVSNGPAVAHDAGARLRIPEPKAYNGARDAKEVENFLFDIEQYFLAANANQVRLDTWALLREAIREQFFPENVEYNARRALRKLEHSGSVRDYVKSFSALMLDIRDMSEKDKLFTFMEGLKPWARLELQRQRVTDLGSAMAAAERLTDFALETRKDRQTTSSPVQNKTGGARSFRSNSNRGGGDRKPYAQTGSQGSSVRNKPQENRQGRRRRE
ncbi:UNVERIFIED_CONTAM: hypothetical protein Slati_0519500 [Sesamum latifolium]|uniref:Retrotransposon gag domain-containing protein n=1 Tax=Sesamum latifolium TaxID=2727402 RepID=A0AAW2XXV6_9LAMI